MINKNYDHGYVNGQFDGDYDVDDRGHQSPPNPASDHNADDDDYDDRNDEAYDYDDADDGDVNNRKPDQPYYNDNGHDDMWCLHTEGINQ